ncbi:hypothetical protein UFOVP190_356 [uncultured Caudovirales phage]|uniref:Uncharacterized protein n=1 Tax=uncultured Caudovirales phage TaxID=2100421 RepID=A0A6J7WHX3_9CAUD|nr:hypothetical protein UFOVP190_356 [uncultured Caudovirales phage]
MTTVTLPYDPLWTALEWAKKHCPNYITNDAHMIGYNSYDNTYTDYFFGNEAEATMFRLKWS